MRVEVQNLRRHFRDTKAVDGISFSFGSGEVFGFVGPNGAGKTTTMRIMATLDDPTDGDIAIDGVSIKENPERARPLLGFVPDALPTHDDMTVHEYLDFFARSFGLRGTKRHAAVEGVEEFANLTGIREKLLKDLSKGMKQRVSVGRALVHDPPVLIMDEPAAGLDPRARVELRELLSLLAEQNKAILISSHVLTELSEICTGAVIIERGRLLETGSINDLVERSDRQTHGRIAVRAMEEPAELRDALLLMPNVASARIEAGEVVVEVERDHERAAVLLAELIRAGHRIIEFRHIRTDLEDVFMTVTKGDVQ